MRSSLTLGIVFAAATWLGCGESKSEPDPGPGSAAPVDAAPPPTPKGPTSHPETAAGLEAQLAALLAASESKDAERLAAHTKALVLDKPEEWFAARFSQKKLGARLYEEYEPLVAGMPQLVKAIEEQRAAGLTEIIAAKYEKTDDLSAVGYQTKALKKMVTATPLYSVRLKSPDKKRSFHIWSFVHQDGNFRFIGKMKKLAKADMLGDLDLGEFTPVDATRLRNSAKTDGADKKP